MSDVADFRPKSRITNRFPTEGNICLIDFSKAIVYPKRKEALIRDPT